MRSTAVREVKVKAKVENDEATSLCRVLDLNLRPSRRMSSAGPAPTCSVVVPVYNSEGSLCELASRLNATRAWFSADSGLRPCLLGPSELATGVDLDTLAARRDGTVYTVLPKE